MAQATPNTDALRNFELRNLKFHYHDNPAIRTALFFIGELTDELRDSEWFERTDDHIFFYIDSPEELERLYLPDNGEDFILVREEQA